MGEISFQYSAWYLLLCALFALLVTAVLYYRDSRFREQALWLRGLLATLRFLAVFLISVLLLTPLLKSKTTETRDPVVVFLQDGSQSVGSNWTEEEKTVYQDEVNGFVEELEEKYQVETFTFGDEAKAGLDFSFQDQVTNLSEVLSGVYDLYSNQNLGAVLVASDGIYNEGSNPIYVADDLTAPVYTIALGDTSVQRDLILKRVFNNRIAYLGDKFSIEVDIQARNCRGESSVLTVSRVAGGRLNELKRVPFTIEDDNYFRTEEIILDADRPGVQRYRISLSRLENEASTANNVKDIFIDVLDARQKVLVLAYAPHPDLTALRQAISDNRNYEVTVDYLNNMKADLAEFDLVVLHQIPAINNSARSLLARLDELKKPRLYVLGMQANFNQFNRNQDLLKATVDGRNTNDVQADVNEAFTLFTLDEQVIEELPRFAPLIAPFGDFEAGPSARVLLYQRIGKVDTKYPLLLFGEEKGVRTGVLTAEGIWKWRLFDFLQNKNHRIFNELVGKSVQYLSVKEDKRRFRVDAFKNIFKENEPIVLDAELYNESYELINEPDATLAITNEEGEQFDFTFNRKGKGYSLNAGLFPTGSYTFKAGVMDGGKRLTYQGQFSVEPVQLEAFETTARHGLLRQLSEKYGGQLYYPGQFSALATQLKEADIRPVSYQTSKTRPLTHLKWIFFVLLLLLTLEWFLRRYFGEY